MIKTFFSILMLSFVVSSNSAFAVGEWDTGASLVAVSANEDYQAADSISIKKATAGLTKCQVVKFKPGYGNIPNNANGTEAIKRIYSTALAALMAGRKINVWVWDTANCYGIMLNVGDSDPF